MKKFFWFLSGILCATGAFYLYSQMSESHKRYVTHLLKQVPYMAARYKV